MSEGINLLVKQKDVSFKEKERIRLLKIISAIALIVVAITIAALLGLYSQLKTPEIKKNQELIVKNITPLRDKSTKLYVINNRAEAIAKILKERKNFQQIINKIVEQFPQNVQLSGMEVTDKKMNLRISLNSLYDAKVLVDKMIVLAGEKKIIKDLTIDSLTFDVKNSRYNLSISSNLL